MLITDIEIYRDGGTIEFRISHHRMSGLYRLPPLWEDRPPNLIRDDVELPERGPDEEEVLAALRDWLNANVTSEIAESLAELEVLRLWQNLPDRLVDAIPFHYIRSVFEYLSKRWGRIDPSWLTITVISLAQAIYDERAFDRMPILADALEDAGCINEEILNHCRQPGEHVRGCWAVDLLLGKK